MQQETGPLLRTKSLANKVTKDIDCAHIISVDFGMKYKKKQKTHKLTDKQAAQSLAHRSTLRRWLSRRKLPYIVTLDEMYLSRNDTTGKRDGYYETKEKPATSEYKKKANG